MIIICLYNNAVINNDYGRFQESILLFKIPCGIRKNFFESHRQSGHEPSKLLASPALQQTSHHSVMLGSYAFLPSSGAEEVFAVLDILVV
jgi:hypothetical protein